MLVVDNQKSTPEHRNQSTFSYDSVVADSALRQCYFDKMGEIFLELNVGNV